MDEENIEVIEIQEKPIEKPIVKKELKARGATLEGVTDMLNGDNVIKRAKTLKKTQLSLEELKKELINMPMPRSVSDKKERKRIEKIRKKLSRAIIKAQDKVKDLSEKCKDIIFEDERKQIANLARSVGYNLKNFDDLDPVQFENHKKSCLLKASKHYQDFSSMAVSGIIQLGGIFEGLEYGRGTQINLLKTSPHLKTCVNNIFIDIAKKDTDFTKYFNPWSTLALFAILPVVGTFLTNWSTRKKNMVLSEKIEGVIDSQDFEKKNLIKKMNPIELKEYKKKANLIRNVDKDLERNIKLTQMSMEP